MRRDSDPTYFFSQINESIILEKSDESQFIQHVPRGSRNLTPS